MYKERPGRPHPLAELQTLSERSPPWLWVTKNLPWPLTDRIHWKPVLSLWGKQLKGCCLTGGTLLQNYKMGRFGGWAAGVGHWELHVLLEADIWVAAALLLAHIVAAPCATGTCLTAESPYAPFYSQTMLYFYIVGCSCHLTSEALTFSPKRRGTESRESLYPLLAIWTYPQIQSQC